MEQSEHFQTLVAFTKELDHRLLQCKEAVNVLEQQHERVQDDIEKHFDNCLATLAVRKDHLLQESESVFSEQKFEIEKISTQLQQSSKTSDEMLKAGANIFTLNRQIAENMWKGTHFLTCPEVYVPSMKAKLPESIFEEIQNHGNIVTEKESEDDQHLNGDANISIKSQNALLFQENDELKKQIEIILKQKDKELAEMQNELNILKESIGTIDELQTHTARIEEQHSKAENECEELKNEVTRLNGIIAQLQTDINKGKSEVNELQQIYEEQETVVRKQAKENAELARENTKLKDDINEFSNAKNNESERFLKLNDKLRAEIVILDNKLRQQEYQIEVLQGEVNNVTTSKKKEISKLEILNNEISQQLQEAENEGDQLKKEVARLTRELKHVQDLEKKINDLTTELQQKHSFQDTAINKQTKENNVLSLDITALRTENNNFKNEISELQQKLEEHNVVVKTQAMEITQLHSENNKLKDDMEKLSIDWLDKVIHDKKQNQLERQLTELQNKLDSMTVAFEEDGKTIAHWEQCFKTLNQQFNETKNENIKLKTEISELKPDSKYKLVPSSTSARSTTTRAKRRSSILREYTKEDLQRYTGSDPSTPILIALKGKVFDVTRSRDRYGPGGVNAIYAGHDVSFSIVTGSLEITDLDKPFDQLTSSQMTQLNTWVKSYEDNYISVGWLKGYPSLFESANTSV